MQGNFIAGLDVGTTQVRCNIYDLSLKLKGHASDKIRVIYPQQGYAEIEPNELFISIKSVINQALQDANITAKDLNCIGITTQRSSFITWEKGTGKYFHNFITWQDLRADSLCEKWNSSIYLSMFKAVSSGLYFVTGNHKFLVGKVMKFLNPSVVARLAWMIRNTPELKKAMKKGTAVCGTLDAWLLYKLRQNSHHSHYIEHISDYSNCTTTAFFDPFTLKYAGWLLKLLKINERMLPKPVTNSHDFGSIDSTHFGHHIKIASSIADQPASMWGQGCFRPGDVKVTLGTGAFLNINCGRKCHASNFGLYPIVAWQMGKETVYCVEGASNDMGSTIEWAVASGFIDNVKTCSALAQTVPDTDGVIFIPALAGLGPPINDQKASCGFIGVKPSTTKAHMVRAILEGLTFRVALLVQCIRDETEFKLSVLKVDGGVSNNDFICQTLADITGLMVERSSNPDMTVLGAVYMAGLNQELWTADQMMTFMKIDKTFVPDHQNVKEVHKSFRLWQRGAQHFSNWY